MATPSVPRVPSLDPNDHDRHRRAHDMLAAVLDSFVQQGFLTLTGQNQWSISGASGSGSSGRMGMSVAAPPPQSCQFVPLGFHLPSAVANYRPDGSVVFIDAAGQLSVSPLLNGYSTFQFDDTGVGTAPTLYVGEATSGGTVGVLALANGGNFTTFVPSGDGSGLTINADLTVSSFIATIGQFATTIDLYNGGGSDDTGLYIRANTTQSSDVFRMSSQGGTVWSLFNKDGYFMTRKVAAPADGDVATSEVSYWWDNTAGAPRVSFKGKDSGGTVASFSIGYRTLGKQGADVASANDTTLSQGNYFDITGTTTINGIASAGWTAGSVVTLQFDSTPTVKHNTAASAGFASLLLAGAVDFVASANDTLTLVYDGTTWRETGRAVI